MSRKKRHKKVRKITNRQAKVSTGRYKNIRAQSAKAHIKDMLARQQLPVKELEVIVRPDNIRLSDVILKLADPLIQKNLGRPERIEKIIAVAVTAWNISMFPEEKQRYFRARATEHLFPDDRDTENADSLVCVLDLIMERKAKYFPGIRQTIVGYNLSVTGKHIALDVTSVPFVNRKI